MIKKTFFTITISFFALLPAVKSEAQALPEEYGSITPEILNMKFYDKDPQADAVVLSDVGKTYFQPNNENTFNVVFERTTRIKIFRQSALEIADIEIPYYYEGNSLEHVDDITAVTYNIEDGKIFTSVLSPGNIYDEKINEYWRQKKFALPEVREGSVIEYRYTITSPFLWNLRDWAFQSKIPTVYSNYIVRMTPFYEYKWILQGANGFSSQKDWVDHQNVKRFLSASYKDFVHEYTMTYVPAFRSEDYITSINDYIIKIDFQLHKIHPLSGATIDVVGTWPALIKELGSSEKFGKYEAKAEKAASKIFDLESLEGLPDAEKYDIIVRWVKSNYNWNGYYGKYANENLNRFLELKTGNSGNINLMLAGLLNAAGIEAFPVILSTRNNGKIKDVPFLNFFDYVIVAAPINGSLLLADATETFTPSDELPVRCLNDIGLAIKKDTVWWVNLSPVSVSGRKADFTMRFSENCDTINATMESLSTGYKALEARKRYYNETGKIAEDCSGKGYIVEADSIEITNMLKPDSSIIISFPLKTETERVGKRLIISPFLNEPVSINRLIQDSRTYPIDFIYPESQFFSCKIIMPDNSSVVSVPDKLLIENDLVKISYETRIEGNDIYVTGEYSFKKALYRSADYNRIKYYFNQIVKTFNGKIIIEVD